MTKTDAGVTIGGTDGPRQVLRQLFDAALQSADPMVQVGRHLPQPPKGRVVVTGAGKAAAKMARAVELHWPDVALTGIVVTRYGHAVACDRIEVLEASHPVPDAAGVAATQRILDLVSGLGPDDLVLVLISGGGSALLTLPAKGLSLEDKQAVNSRLLASGAAIGEINCVRKHLSGVKGGRLGLAFGSTPSLTLLISDVPGDDPTVIASGPTFGEKSTAKDALEILERYSIGLPDAVRTLLEMDLNPCPASDDVRLANAAWAMIATPAMALDAAATLARHLGYSVVILGDDLEGNAADLGREHAQLALRQRESGPLVILSGGETSVKVVGNGRGGRNVEYLLSLCLHLDGAAGIYALAADTDGIDGIEDVAGGVIDPASKARAQAAGLRIDDFLARNDAHAFFEALGDQVITGPTLTNVNDFRAILIDVR